MGHGMSDLELELERDVGGSFSSGEYEEGDEESSLDDELEDDEAFTGALDDAESDEELDDAELIEPDLRGFAERFYELSLRDGESEEDRELEVSSILREMEREYFLKGLLKKVAPAAKGLFRTGLALAKSATPLGQVVNAATALSRGNLRGMLGSLANSALSLATKHPALAAAMPVLSSLGFKPGAPSKAGWGNFAQLAKNAYGQLRRNLDKEAADPAHAADLANRAFRSAIGRAKQMARVQIGDGASGLARSGNGRKVITLSAGDTLVIRVR